MPVEKKKKKKPNQTNMKLDKTVKKIQLTI